MRSYFKKSWCLLKSFVTHPREMARIIANTPEVLDGMNLARDTLANGQNLEECMNTPQESYFSKEENALMTYFTSHQEGRGITKWLHYFEQYHKHLAKFVGRNRIELLEIGIYSGGSLEMWKSYLGDGARITGVDIAESCRVYESDHVSIAIGDQGNPDFWKTFLSEGKSFDIVIDDGGHLPHQQKQTLNSLMPLMKSGGIYICEDIHRSHQAFGSFVNGLSNALNAYNLHQDGSFKVAATEFQKRIKGIHRYPFMTVIEFNDHAQEVFECPRHGTIWQPFNA